MYIYIFRVKSQFFWGGGSEISALVQKLNCSNRYSQSLRGKSDVGLSFRKVVKHCHHVATLLTFPKPRVMVETVGISLIKNCLFLRENNFFLTQTHTLSHTHTHLQFPFYKISFYNAGEETHVKKKKKKSKK